MRRHSKRVPLSERALTRPQLASSFHTAENKEHDRKDLSKCHLEMWFAVTP